MPKFTVRVSADLAARFDARAALMGGRSAHLRQLILADVADVGAPITLGRGHGSAARLMVRLGPEEAAHVRRQALAMSLRPAGWVSALVRRHARGRPTLPRSEELVLLAVQTELHRIGVNVNHIARRSNTAEWQDPLLSSVLPSLFDMQQELRTQLLVVRSVVEGNLAYWEVP